MLPSSLPAESTSLVGPVAAWVVHKLAVAAAEVWTVAEAAEVVCDVAVAIVTEVEADVSSIESGVASVVVAVLVVGGVVFEGERRVFVTAVLCRVAETVVAAVADAVRVVHGVVFIVADASVAVVVTQ